MVETRQLKDNLANQSFALRDLVQTKARLMADIRLERELRERMLVEATAAAAAGSSSAAGTSASSPLPPSPHSRKLSSTSLSAAAALGMTISPVLGRVVKRSEEVRSRVYVCVCLYVCARAFACFECACGCTWGVHHSAVCLCCRVSFSPWYESLRRGLCDACRLISRTLSSARTPSTTTRMTQSG